MLSKQDLNQIAKHGITQQMVEHQLQQIEKGFPFLKIETTAAIGNGIFLPNAEQREKYVEDWSKYIEEGHNVIKFVPASGAASRMFKNLFAFLDADYTVPRTDFEKEFFENIKHFAFKHDLCNKCKENEGACVCDLKKSGKYKEIVANLLEAKGLNYGQLPKGLLLFHSYNDGSRTPMEEHLVEAALYASSEGKANIHFTVSHDHLDLFKKKVGEKKSIYEKKFGIHYNISFSEQKPSTDTIAATLDNKPFRNEDGTLLFRPGGHGALIENLNDIDADVIFIKNIDNVVPDRIKGETILYKKMIAGILIDTQKHIFDYIRLLDSGEYNHSQIEEIIRFVQQTLCCRKKDIKELEDADLVIYLKNKLNRPIRVCGVVKNIGEPGGGPFLCYNSDGTISPQILESSQIDSNNPEYVKMFKSGTHFNPVDIVCSTKDYKGNKFDLNKYVDHNTGFISSKSKNGKELKALELPGLWNGAMSNWNTIFVEVPISTFNPVKTVNDLLREQHQ